MRLDAERRARVPTVCPFVAFVDERDLRADEPDHRHRCFAEAQPAPRALAHQERYCLSPDFTSCPTFQDWAVRSAAAIEGDAGRTAVGAADFPGLFDEPAGAPPPAGSSTSPSGYESYPASGPRVDDAFGQEETGERAQEGEAVLAGGASAGVSGVALWTRRGRREAYPRLRRSGASIPPILWAIVGLALAAGVLFLLPSLITGFFSGGGVTPTASPTPVVTETPAEPTPEPEPTPLVYIVQKGDTLLRIASKFDVTLEELTAANPQIKNPNKISIGDRITIPTPSPAPDGSPGESPLP